MRSSSVLGCTLAFAIAASARLEPLGDLATRAPGQDGATSAPAQQAPLYPDMPSGKPPKVAVPEADAASAAEMKRYVESVPGVKTGFAMVPIPAGRFVMGSAPGEKRRKKSESPQHEVELAPFWIAECETTWDVYHVFMLKLDRELRRSGLAKPEPQDAWADAVSRPTPPYVPMDFGMGVEGFPAISMTQFAARQFTKWLSMKTGRFYRLPTEAEWEYACRAGTTSAYSFGDDAAQLGDYAWFFGNSGEHYHKVREKKPNPWGLYDMHGNVAEWVLDAYDEQFYETSSKGVARDPIAWPSSLYPRVVRGGSWDDDDDKLRSAARRGSLAQWQDQDPQLPKSIWYLTDAKFVGFRVVRPFSEPSDADQAKSWDADVDAIRKIQDRQRTGAR